MAKKSWRFRPERLAWAASLISLSIDRPRSFTNTSERRIFPALNLNQPTKPRGGCLTLPEHIFAVVSSIVAVVSAFIAYHYKRKVEKKPQHESLDLRIKELDFRSKQISLLKEATALGCQLPELAEFSGLLTNELFDEAQAKELVQSLLNSAIHYIYISIGLMGKQIADMGKEAELFDRAILEWWQLDLIRGYQLLKDLKLTLTAENDDVAQYVEQLRADPPGKLIPRFLEASESKGELSKAEADIMRLSLKNSLESIRAEGDEGEGTTGASAIENPRG